MKKLVIILLAGTLFPFCVNAQLGKQMSKYHEKAGVTVTQLDKNLYGLYQRENLTPEIKEMLQKLDEVNILNLDAETCKPELYDKILTQFHGILSNTDKYKLVKSKSDGVEKQLIYTTSKNGTISDLIVWDQSPEQTDIIELRGDIQLDRIALLSRALNLNGLSSLAVLSSQQNEVSPKEMRETMKAIQNMRNGLMADDGFGGFFENFFGNSPDSTARKNNFIFPFGQFDKLFDMFDDLGSQELQELMKPNGHSQKMEQFFQSFGDGSQISSNSIQITEENGKTKLKIDSKNSDITYIIDGKQAPKNNIQMPDKIRNVNMIPSREDMKKTYLFITSQNKLGSFNSYQNGIITFNYDNQEYKFNLDKVREPLLVIDGRLASSFDIDPSDILQIRPISQVEKEVGYYPNAEIIINTK